MTIPAVVLGADITPAWGNAVADFINGTSGDAYTSYTPVVVQGATPSLTVGRAKYIKTGRNVRGDGFVTATSGGTAANQVAITMPFDIASTSANSIIGEVWLADASSGLFYYGILMRSGTKTCNILRRLDAAGPAYLGSSGFTAALASGDVIAYRFDYEATS